ncbi:MAG: hypothetical protein OHK0013_18740 [Sandaracinaceae bacterium]
MSTSEAPPPAPTAAEGPSAAGASAALAPRARGRAALLALFSPGALPTTLALAAATALVAWPLLGAAFLPFVDYPQHLGTIAAIHGQGDPRFSPYFVVEYARTQYLVPYVLGDWLAYLFGVEGSGRATAVLGVATLPLAVAFWLREHGRPAILGAASAGIALHMYVFWGFLNYAMGMVVALLALTALARLAREPDARHAALAATLGLVCFYTHAQLYAWMGLAAIVQLAAMSPALGRSTALRALAASVLAAIPSIAGAIVWIRLSGVIEHGEAGARSGHAEQVEHAPAIFSAVHETVRSWLDHSFGVYHDGSGEQLAVGFFAVIGLLIALRGGRAGSSAPVLDEAAPRPVPTTSSLRARLWARAPARAPVRSHAPELVLALTFAAYLFAPFSYRMIEPINHRFLPLALALLPALGPTATLALRARWLVATATLALAVATGTVHRAHFVETDEEMGELADALAYTEPGHRLLGLVYDAQSRVVRAPIYLHAHQYYQARVGGLACFSFVEFPKSPVQYRAGAEPPPFPPRFEWEPTRYDHHVWGDAFDYWLVRHEPHRSPPRIFRSPSPSGAAEPVQVVQTDRWTLFATPSLRGAEGGRAR